MAHIDYNHSTAFQVEFSKAISTKEYRKFCKENNLNFQYNDEIEAKNISSYLSYKELELHWKIRKYFNRTKDQYTIYKDEIINYYINEYLEPAFKEKMSISSFIEKYNMLEKEYKDYKEINRVRYAVTFYTIILWMIVLFYYFKLPFHISQIIDVIVMLFIPYTIVVYLPKFIIRIRHKRNDFRDKRERDSEFDYIRKQLLLIKNNFSNPV